MAPLKKKGDLAELKVAADLIARGCELSIPFGEDSSYDLTKHYTAAMVDWIAAYDVTTDRCYYVPSWTLGAEGRSQLWLRLVPALNGQSLRIRRAEDYPDPDFGRDPSMEPAGIEPATS
jgi:hypothetical protein